MAPLIALAILGLLALLNRGHEWVVTGIAAGDSASVLPAAWSGAVSPILLVDGRPVPLTDRSTLTQLFRTARHLETTDSIRVTLQLGDLLNLEVGPGSRIGCPNTPGRFVDNEIELTLIEGTLRLVKGPGLGSRRVVALTPEARIEIDGEVVGLHRDSLASRVDVYEGEVRVGSAAPGEPLTVRAGSSAIVRAGSRPVAVPIDPGERSRLARLRGRGFRSADQIQRDAAPGAARDLNPRPGSPGRGGTAGRTSPG